MDPVQPIQTPVVPPKPVFPWKIMALVIVVIALSVGITLFLVKGPFSAPTVVNNPQPTITITDGKTYTDTSPTAVTSPDNTLPTKTAVSAVSPTASSCDVSDNAFCNVLADLKTAVKTQNYAGFLAYQKLQSTTCDPDGMFMAVCEGIAKGVVKQGYSIGYIQSEGAMVTENDYIQAVSAYVNSNGPFVYRGSLVSDDKGMAVFLNAKKDQILAFPMKRTGLTWRMDYLLFGFGNEAYINLSNSILEY